MCISWKPKSRIISFMDEVVTDVGGSAKARKNMASRTAAVPGMGTPYSIAALVLITVCRKNPLTRKEQKRWQRNEQGIESEASSCQGTLSFIFCCCYAIMGERTKTPLMFFA